MVYWWFVIWLLAEYPPFDLLGTYYRIIVSTISEVKNVCIQQ